MQPSSTGALTPADLAYNTAGLLPAIIQDHTTGEVLMLGWMNRETLFETLDTGRTVFWSRSRNERWRKGDTSGDRQWVREVSYDCDGDTLLVRVDQEGGGACHTGARTCFYRSLQVKEARRDAGAPGEGAPRESAPGRGPAGRDREQDRGRGQGQGVAAGAEAGAA